MSAPITASPAPSTVSQQILRSAKLVAIFGNALGVFQLLLSYFLVSDEAASLVFEEFGYATIFCSQVWTLMLFSRAVRMEGSNAGAARSSWRIYCGLILVFGVAAAATQLLDSGILAIFLGVSFAFILTTALSISLTYRKESRDINAELWTETHRLKSGNKTFLISSCLLVPLCGYLPLLAVCGRDIKDWHSKVLRTAPQRLREWVYRWEASDKARLFLIETDGISPELLIREMREARQIDPYRFRSLHRQNPALALDEVFRILSAVDLRGTENKKSYYVKYQDELESLTGYLISESKLTSPIEALVNDKDFAESVLLPRLFLSIKKEHAQVIMPAFQNFLLSTRLKDRDLFLKYLKVATPQQANDLMSAIWLDENHELQFIFATMVYECWGVRQWQAFWLQGIQHPKTVVRQAMLSAIPYFYGANQLTFEVKKATALLLNDPDLIVRRMAATHTSSWIFWRTSPLTQIHNGGGVPQRLMPEYFSHPEDPQEAGELTELKKALRDEIYALDLK